MVDDIATKLKSLGITNGLVIGSRAIQNLNLFNDNSDIDIIVPYENIPLKYNVGVKDIITISTDEYNVEIHVAKKNGLLYNIVSDIHTIEFADIQTLYSFKRSHIMHPSHKWCKHMYDMNVLYDTMTREEKMSIHADNLLSVLIKYNKNINKKRHNIKLNKSKESFFNDNVIQYFEHDYLHELMAYEDRPMYEKMQGVNDAVMCRYELWIELSYDEKIKCVLEESYVIACERILIPHIIKKHNFNYNSPHAIMWAIMRICTTLTSGWFRDFAIDNYYNICRNIDYDYHNKIKFLFNNGYDLKVLEKGG